MKRGLIIAVVLLSVAVVGLGGLSIYALNERNAYYNEISNQYDKAFYDLVAEVDDINVKLKKIDFSSSKNYQRQLLYDVWRLSDVAESNLSSLSYENGVIVETSKMLNQLGDYSKYLAEKDRALNEEEKTAISSIYATSLNLGRELRSVMESDSYSLRGEESVWASTISEYEDTSVDYPALIYDGPFSDSIQNKTPRGVYGKAISENDGLAYLKEILKEHCDTSTLKYVGNTDGRFVTYNYQGDGITVSLTHDGTLITLNVNAPVGESEYSEQQCLEVAEKFVENAGYDGVTQVWLSNYYDNVYVNFAYKESDVICYSDLIKVKVSRSTGKVIGVEGINYCYNHTVRDIAQPTISKTAVLNSLREDVTVENVRLALIPRGNGEILTYEIFGTYNGDKYFLYLDAETGEEINVLTVVDGEQGLLL